MKKRMGKTIIAALVISIALAACSRATDTVGKNPAGEEGKTVLTLSVQEASPFYTALERKFEAKFPDIDLIIQAYKQAGEEWKAGEIEEYRKSVNTALLSGQGPDVIEMKSLPISEYIAKGLLLNMDSSLSGDGSIKKEDLQQNILDAARENGGLYAIPGGFSLRAFIGDGDALKEADIQEKTWTWQDFAEIAKKLTQGNEKVFAMTEYPPDMLMQEMTVDNYEAYVDTSDKQAKFDSPEFIALLHQVKQMYDDGVMTEESAGSGKQLFYSAVLRDPKDVIDVPHQYFEHPILMQKPHNPAQSGTMRIIPTSLFGIRAKSQVPEEAWKLIRFLLSEEAQKLPEREGFSLLSSINSQQLDDIKQQIADGSYKLPDGAAVKAADEEFDRFRQMLDAVDQYSPLEAKVISIVGEESLAFFSGQKSAEEAAKLMQNRVTTFLNE
ncbi:MULTISPECIES: ABC transporter substrate-binding protein [Paenibacillus]|jgi:multiple sugar transport system substrate-binding protein|uniref:ABC transporter substrate-binding protein n=1 Tax=Paenibacillus TaxID=44249 RepID=UPI00048F57BB|nr:MULTISPECIES: ABC transporter substrate-binding protein [Paenibacillus]MDU0330897.1 ABC transporter substrate-binding protein [Paenibacillus sp. 3LSP]MEC2345799.1 ABC transporter substrate-binding protein [Paenibacillus barengoltzii]